MDATDELRAEVDRLRDLVGPTEASYADLRRELEAAADLVRAAETEAGALRGRVRELEFEITRLRNHQERFAALVVDRVRGRLGRTVRTVRRFRG